ncbi:hypothetical protein BOX15_Mlig005505g1 [Macrostomum lignano]|uniref:Peptidase A1 domain-containing protein n=1 Tax=Macrostomum lignano TaxID=282301 RepID=A0A267F3I1_9PLAT|nr:hypothetical protein BOX15_Mlig005505g1 [Macrostomum lignano]
MTSSIGLLRSVTTLVRLIVIISASLQRSATGEDSARTSGFSIGLRHLRYLIPGGKSVHGYQELSKRSFVPFETSERNLKGSPGQGYCLEMGIGTPPQFFNILIDTGSSNFAVAGKPHSDIKRFFHADQSSTIVWQGQSVYVPYTQGRWNGHLATDLVRMSFYPNRTIRPYIAVIDSSKKFFIHTADWQGILGMAYSHIASPHPKIKTFFDSLVEQWGLTDVFSLQLCGTTRAAATSSNASNAMDGSLTLGGVDPKLMRGPLLYVPIRKEWYYEVVIVDIKMNGTSLGMDCKEYNMDKTIVDSGTTDIRLPMRVFTKIISQLASQITGVGDRFYRGETLLCLSEKTGPWKLFPMLTFSLLYSDRQQIDLHLSPQQYLRYVGEVFDIPGKDCFKFGLQGSKKGAILGAVLMEGYYVIFDRAKRRIGFAQSTCNTFTKAVPASNLTGPLPYPGTVYSPSAWDCAYFQANQNYEILFITALVMAIVCVLCVVPVCSLLIYRQVRKCRNAKQTDGEKSRLVPPQ